MSATAIIFGSSGQDGHYLSKLLEQRGISVIAVSRQGVGVNADVADWRSVKRLISEHLPLYVIHLAANSTTSHQALFENHQTISTGTINVLEAVKLYSPESKVFITGSGVQFANQGVPISERDDFEANSPYSIARIQSVYAARYYRTLGVQAYIGYLFHHESPLRKNHHVSQLIANTVLRISDGSNEVLELGDISVEKEWTFAGDVAAAILCLLEQDSVNEATVGSGITYSIQEWLEQCFGIIGKDWRRHTRIKKAFNAEYKKLVSDPMTIKSLGWAPVLDFAELANLMVKNSED
jgi:GDPmannose 4,6-dehydratase